MDTVVKLKQAIYWPNFMTRRRRGRKNIRQLWIFALTM